MDALRDQRGWPWLQSVFADMMFAFRQLKKHRTASVAAILSLGLAIGATTAAFRCSMPSSGAHCQSISPGGSSPSVGIR